MSAINACVGALQCNGACNVTFIGPQEPLVLQGVQKKVNNKTNENGQTCQACQHSKSIQRGPKWSEIVNLDVFDRLGPFWARVDPLGQFQTKMIFCSKAPLPNPTLSLWGSKLIFVCNGPRVSRWAQKGPKLSKRSRFTISDPFGPLWTHLEC